MVPAPSFVREQNPDAVRRNMRGNGMIRDTQVFSLKRRRPFLFFLWS